MLSIVSRSTWIRVLVGGLAVGLVGVGIASQLGLYAIDAGFVGLMAGDLAGGLLGLALAKAAERPGVGRAAGVSFLPRAVLILAAFLWIRRLWPGAEIWLVPGYLAGEGVWVALALRRLRILTKE